MTSPIYPPTGAVLERAVHVLREGGLVGLPTETVYGLAADARNDAAVARIYEVKGRPHFNPLIVHAHSLEQLTPQAYLSPLARSLAERFWPGPLTLVLQRAPGADLSLLAAAGLDTLAVRIPAHPVALSLLSLFGHPLVAPSANPSNGVSPTRAEHVAQGLNIPMVLDGGPCEHGLESTVVDARGEQIVLLRPGAVTTAQLEQVAPVRTAQGGESAASPGNLRRHYAPSKPVRLDAISVEPSEGLLAFGAPLAGAETTRNLSPEANLREAAANLFAMLRELDDEPVSAIAVMPVPDEGLGQAINDRLRRAATR